jgi:hypothetical protein
MRIKVILSVVLLLFIASSIAAIVVRTIRDASEGGHQTAESANPAAGARVVVYYFHSKVRCSECKTIESYGHEAVSEGFADDLRSGRLQWRVLNYEDPQNRSLAKQFEVIAPTIVVVRLEDGKPVRWDNLSDVWGLTGDKAEFLEYVRTSVRSFLTGGGDQAK